MPNLIVISLVIFPYMYVGLSVKDECERLMKNRASKVESMDFATGLWVAIREKTMCAHDWKMKSCARLSFLWLSREKGQPLKNPQKFLFGKMLCFALPFFYPYYIYPHYSRIVRSAFQRENTKKYTWELEIIIPTIIYTFTYGFPQLLPFHL